MKEFFNLGNHTKTVVVIFVIIIICVIFYLVKNFKTIDIQLKFLLMILILGSAAGISLSKKEDKDVELLQNDFSLTTGNIEEYIVPNMKGYRGNTSNSIKYVYKVDKEFISHSYYENYFISIPNDKPDLNILYLVIYEKTNPKNSFILLNYPVNSAEDLKRYEKMFRDKIPADAIKQN